MSNEGKKEPDFLPPFLFAVELFLFYLKGLQFMPVDCTSVNITQLTLKDWPLIKREAPK